VVGGTAVGRKEEASSAVAYSIYETFYRDPSIFNCFSHVVYLPALSVQTMWARIWDEYNDVKRAVVA
jgi:hypothetical protein